MSRSAPQRSMPRAILLRALLFGFTLVGGLLVVEGTLRLLNRFDPHPGAHDRLFEYDDDLGWRFIAGQSEVVVWPGQYRQRVSINEAGFRDASWGEAGRHLAILGDSFTTNFGAHADSVFTEQIERLLAAGPEPLTVRNYGVNGYGQAQQALLLERSVLEERPVAVVVVMYLRNDLDENGAKYWTERYSRPRAVIDELGQVDIRFNQRRHEVPPPSLATRWRQSLHLGVALREIHYALRPTTVPLHHRPPELRWCSPWGDDERRAFDITVRLIEGMDSACRERGIPFGVVLAPSLWQVDTVRFAELVAQADSDSMEVDRPQRAMMRALSERSIPSLDLLEPLRGANPASGRLYYPVEQHWTEAAQSVVARAIYDWCESEVRAQ